MKTSSCPSWFAIVFFAVVPLVVAATDSGATRPAQILTSTDPKYPYLEQRAEAAAEVTVTFTVNARGIVTKATVKETTNRNFNESALAAINQWTFAPAMKDGMPVAARLQQTFLFSVRDLPNANSKEL